MKFNTRLQLKSFEGDEPQSQGNQVAQQDNSLGQNIQSPVNLNIPMTEDPGINFLISTYKSNPSIINDPEVASVLNPILKQIQTTQPAPVKAGYINQAQGQMAQAAPVEQNIQSRVTQNGQTVAVVEGQDDFVNQTGIFKKKEFDYQNVTMENLPEIIAQRHGIDTSKQDWLPTFLRAVDTHRKNATEKVKFEETINTYKSNLQALPLPVQMAIDSSLKGEDWRSAINTYDIDYNKDFDSYTLSDKISLVKKYMPTVSVNETTAESDPILQNLLAAAKIQYNSNKQAIKASIDLAAQKEAEKVKEYQSILSNSLTLLQSKYPDEFQDNDLSEIKNVLIQGVENLFFDERGKLRTDAAERVAYVLYGQNLIDKISSKTSAKKVNNELANVLSTTQSRGVGSQTQNVSQPMSPEIQSLQGLLTSMQPTY